MLNIVKNQEAILEKLGIARLNPMQEEAIRAIDTNAAVVLLSPTGTGKTLAFLLPLLKTLDIEVKEVQALILVPSRELAIQIEQVTREMGSGFKANAVYGGRAIAKDKAELSHSPAILIGTPGRVGDHIRRETISVNQIKTLILDEFDKSLEVGFEEEMREIISSLPYLEKRILTSATYKAEIPKFTGLIDPVTVNYLTVEIPNLSLSIIKSPERNKLKSLGALLNSLGTGSGIIFCNFKDSIQEVSDFLTSEKLSHVTFHGGMEQKDRERALIKFRNGTSRLILATDLAARGIDIPHIDFIIHYQLPHSSQEFTHRNGRTARMHEKGNAYVLQWENEILPEFIKPTIHKPKINITEENLNWKTLFISGGRKDKISKGDIAGLFFKQGNLRHEELGNIELKQDCAFVAVPAEKASELIEILNNSKLKKKKVRVYLI
ncbi:DEAD/DEAH box helicase [soil metagenome]